MPKQQVHTTQCGKNEKFALIEKIFHEIDCLVTSLPNALSQFFFYNSVKVNLCNFHTVHQPSTSSQGLNLKHIFKKSQFSAKEGPAWARKWSQIVALWRVMDWYLPWPRDLLLLNCHSSPHPFWRPWQKFAIKSFFTSHTICTWDGKKIVLDLVVVWNLFWKRFTLFEVNTIFQTTQSLYFYC